MRKDYRTAATLRLDPVRHAAYLERKRRERAQRQQSNGSETARKRRWRENNPESARRIRQANHAIENAIRAGKLTRPDSCSKCGATCIPDGHHPSYERAHWLDVIWLCDSCHQSEHASKHVNGGDRCAE